MMNKEPLFDKLSPKVKTYLANLDYEGLTVSEEFQLIVGLFIRNSFHISAYPGFDDTILDLVAIIDQLDKKSL